MSEHKGPNHHSPARTELETAFIRRACPRPELARLLDVCCGMGRHARAQAQAGYTVTGVERDAQAVATAQERGGGPAARPADVRDSLYSGVKGPAARSTRSGGQR